MKLTRKTPCKECPFKKNSLSGWLGPWTVDSIISQVHSEGGLACHMSVASKSSPEELLKKSHICVGAIQHATLSCKSYRNPILRKFQEILGKGKDILSLLEFKKHHSR